MDPEYSTSTQGSAGKDLALERLATLVRDTGYRFTTITPGSTQRVNARSENAWATDLRGVFGWNRRFRRETVSDELFDCMHASGVAAPDGEGWRSTVRLSTLEDFIFLYSAYPTTDTNSVFFGPDTYRYAAAIRNHLAAGSDGVRRVVDIGSGAGPGAIVVGAAKPDSRVYAVDVNPLALRLTGINARVAGVRNVVTRRSDLLSGIDGDFDLIIANPPYLLDPQERTYRHGGGLMGAGLSIAIVDAALARLSPRGTLLLHTGVAMMDGRDPFLDAIAGKLDRPDLHWDYREIDPDVFGEELSEEAYAQAERIAAVVLTVRRLHS
jgi:methylase of polypeptide subunit release factors